MQPRIYKMNWFVRAITLGMPIAITLAPAGIYIEPEYFDDPQVRNHESIHWYQQIEMLIIFFYLWYIIEWLIRIFINWKRAYMSISLEREAYNNDGDMNYPLRRDPWSWLNYMRQKAKFFPVIIYTSGRSLIEQRKRRKHETHRP